MQTHNVFFKASLSNGETFYEGKPPFQEVEGELSPWQKLIQYTIDKKVVITSLALYTQYGGTWSLPSSGKNPHFHSFKEVEKPIDFNYFHALATEANIVPDDNKMVVDKSTQKVKDFYVVIEAIYPDYKLQIWVDELNVRNSWALAVKI